MKESLIKSLPQSTASERQEWAKTIVDNQVNLMSFSELLIQDHKVSIRFSWLLTDIGMYDSSFLKKHLIELYAIKPLIAFYNLDLNMIKYWVVAGLPTVQEGIALDLCFDLLKSNQYNVTTKRYATLNLIDLQAKYPFVSPELLACLENELNHESKSFANFVSKQLLKIQSQ